jgi:hypothetical protein
MAEDSAGAGMDVPVDENEMSVHPEGKSFTAALPKKILGDNPAVKVGDEIKLKVENVGGDTITVSLVPEESPAAPVMSDEAMKQMSSKAAATMPLDRLEQSLPKAERE